MKRPKRPTSQPLSKTERQALEDLIRRGARALNPTEGNRLLRLLELDQADRQQERRTAGGLMAKVQQLGGQLKDMTARAEAAETQLAELHEGEEPYEDECLVPTPAQWIWLWNQASPAGRLARAARALHHSERLYDARMTLAFHGDRPGWQEAVHAALTGATE